MSEVQVRGTIAVFAKCPIAGSSKTRLSSLLGEDGAADLAKAMLSDILCNISNYGKFHTSKKVLVYAPGTEEGQKMMENILMDIGLSGISARDLDENSSNFEKSTNNWILMPMVSSSKRQGSDNKKSDLQSSDLGSKLSNALERMQRLDEELPVTFLGMDSPELPLDEIYNAMKIAIEKEKAYINPAQDGGYGALCVPKKAPVEIFENVRWSTSLTFASQLKALTDNGIDTVVGSLMSDIDEEEDVMALASRSQKLVQKPLEEIKEINDRLLYQSHVCGSSSVVSAKNSAICPRTVNILRRKHIIANKIKEDE